MEKCIQILVGGRVQGVYYRVGARDRALELGLRGIVRNLRDGRVEILARGSESALERFLEWCWQGPAAARVDEVEVEEWRATCEFETFTISH